MTYPLNVGILAHVDAGKTTLTERMLFEAGVIASTGSVDSGTTQTDTMQLERQRGITIRSAVVSLPWRDRVINLLDTPGHPDFIAEVERALHVLDVAVLVVSAVEGVQAQTRRLARAIERVGVSCLIVINKIDRAGARTDALVAELADTFGWSLVPVSIAMNAGSGEATSTPRALTDASIAEFAAERDDALLEQWLDDPSAIDAEAVREALRRLIADRAAVPVVYASAMQGVGVAQVLDTLADLYQPPTPVDDDLSAEVFKVERDDRRQRTLLCRVWSGSLEVRDVVSWHATGDREGGDGRVTLCEVFREGASGQTLTAGPGDIVRIGGLADAQIGDWLGHPLPERESGIAPPLFESRVDPIDPARRHDLRSALATMADEDPLIGVRHTASLEDIYVHLYGEVQEQVLSARLAEEFGLAAAFGMPRVLCVERLAGVGQAAEISGETRPPYYATVGFRVEPMRGSSSTWTFTPGKAKQGFFDAAEIGGRSVLAQGPYGWPVVDWDVTVTGLIYLVASVPVDYRNLATLVMADAIRDAGTIVCEPMLAVTVRVPEGSTGAVIHAVTSRGGEILAANARDGETTIEGRMPARGIGQVVRELPGISEGRGDLETRFDGYEPVSGDPPRRSRTDFNPFNREEFLARLARGW